MPRQLIDPKSPEALVRITDFPGMSPGTDQHDNAPGLSWLQINAVSLFPGELRARRGFRVIRFDQVGRITDIAVGAGTRYLMTPVAGTVGPAVHPVEAVSSYVASSNAFAASHGPRDLPVAAASNYVAMATSDASIRSDFPVSADSLYVVAESVVGSVGGSVIPVAALSSYTATAVCGASVRSDFAVSASTSYTVSSGAISYISGGTTSFDLFGMF